MRRSISFRKPLLSLFVLLSMGLAPGGTVAEPVYVGAKFCRTCHSSSDRNRYHQWLNSAHAGAFEALTGAEKVDPECLACHTTGHGAPRSEKTTDKDLRGVQCEACHGPGSDYRSMKVMKDGKLARLNGLWEVTREVCLKCHR